MPCHPVTQHFRLHYSALFDDFIIVFRRAIVLSFDKPQLRRDRPVTQTIPTQVDGIVRRIGEDPESYDGREFWNCNIVDFHGQTYVVSHRAILTVVVVSSCNAGCRFCSNEITFTPAGRFLTWNDQLKRVKDFALLSGITKVAYTGGEPTLNPQKLHDLITAMSPGFTKSRMHTNGFGLFHQVDTGDRRRELLPALIDAGLTGISVSVAHFDQETNREIMVLPKSWPGMNEDGLRTIAGFSGSTFTPRLSCVLTEEGVNDIDSIFEYMNWGYELGFRRFIFRTCSEIQDGYKKDTSYTAYNDDNLRSIDVLAESLTRRDDVRLTYRQRKTDSKVDVYRWRDVTFDLDESAEEEDPDEKVRRVNLMTNGVAYTSWIDPLSVLFDDDIDTARRSAARELPTFPVEQLTGALR
jgi:molybdenum cofactor biosynthesis enzyme MoaA